MQSCSSLICSWAICRQCSRVWPGCGAQWFPGVPELLMDGWIGLFHLASRQKEAVTSGEGYCTSQCHMPTAFMTMERPSMYARMPITCAKKNGRGVT